MRPEASVLQQFGVSGSPVPLAGGEGRSFKVSAAVLKHVEETYWREAVWAADLFSTLGEDGFRVSRPLPTASGGWLTEDGWTASTFLEGDHDFMDRISETIDAIVAFHAALRSEPRPALLDLQDDAYARADRQAWGAKPSWVDARVTALVDRLYALRRPVVGLRDQLVHGDLNPENIILAEGHPPAIIDFTPYWRPVEFALAVYAYWTGPWRGEAAVLDHFAAVPQFDQVLVRAALRMLLILSESGTVRDLNSYAEATRIVIERVDG